MIYVARMLRPAVRTGARLALPWGLALGVGATGCFSPPPPPPGFRHSCGSDDQCGSDETCVQGLCQLPCSSVDPELACPDGGGICFNGACSDVCQIDDAHCSAPMECIEVPDVGGGGGFGGAPTEGVGICGSLCDEADPETCPTGEVCILGFCLDPGSLTGGEDSDGGSDGDPDAGTTTGDGSPTTATGTGTGTSGGTGT